MSFRFILPRADVGDGIEDFAGAKLSFFDFGTTDAKITFSDVGLTVQNEDPVVANDDGLFGNIFLDIKYTVTLKTANDVVIWGPLDVQSPSDLITALAASAVTVLDTAANFTATDVEAALAELALDWLRLNRTNAITNILTFSGSGEIRMADLIIQRPLLVDYAIADNTVSSVSGTLTLDLSTGNSFGTTLTENTTVVITNPPATGNYGQLVIEIIQDASAGAFTVTWPSGVIWAGGAAPTITTSNGAIDEITLRTRNAGTSYKGSFGQAFA